MNLSEYAIKRPVTIFMILIGIVIFGVISLTRIPISLFPEIDPSTLLISTDHYNKSPKEVEDQVTLILEKELESIQDIERIYSVSSKDKSNIVVDFKKGEDLDSKILEIEKAILLNSIPIDKENINIYKINPLDEPIIEIAIDKKHGDINRGDIEYIKSELYKIDNVGLVKTYGGFKNYTSLSYDSEVLDYYGVEYGEIISQLERIDEEDDIRNIDVQTASGEFIKLEELVDEKNLKEPYMPITKLDGEDIIILSIIKETGANTTEVSQDVLNLIENIDSYNEHLDINVIKNESDIINEEIFNMRFNVIISIIIIAIVLFIFLRNIRNGLIVLFTVPIFIITSLLIIYFTSISLNIITLGGMIFAIGILLDNSIAVIENIYRHRQGGKSILESSIDGVEEIKKGMVTSTATAIFILLPIVFLEGNSSNIFRDLSIVIGSSLIIALLIAITIVPMLACYLLKVKNISDVSKAKEKKRNILIIIEKSLDDFLKFIRTVYYSFLKKTLDYPKILFTIIILLIGITVISFNFINVDFLPDIEENNLVMDVEFPNIYSLEDSVGALDKIEKEILDLPFVEKTTSRVGAKSFFNVFSDNRGVINITLDKKNSDVKVEDAVSEIKKIEEGIIGVKTNIKEDSNKNISSNTIYLRLIGDDINVLEDITDDLRSELFAIRGIEEIDIVGLNKEYYYDFNANMEVLNYYGFNNVDMDEYLINILHGFEVPSKNTLLKSNNVVENNILDYKLLSTNGERIPMYELGNLEREKLPSTIIKENNNRLIELNLYASNRRISAIENEIDDLLQNYDFPESYGYDIVINEGFLNIIFKNITFAVILGLIISYMILASRFESLINPIIILITIPISLGLGVLGLIITRKSIGILSVIGLLVLMGIVANNSIVLLEAFNRKVKKGESYKNAVLKSCQIRFRPIIMSNISIILALIPFLIAHEGLGNFQRPMAIVIVTGLSLSIFITLFIVPGLYYQIYIIKKFIKTLRVDDY